MTSTDQREPSAFPQVDLPPAYHQLVRQALVREAAAGRRRHLTARRMVPLLAAIAVLVVGVVQVIGPSTVFAPVARLLGISPDGCGASREISPRSADGARYLVSAPPGWEVLSRAVQTRVCIAPLGPGDPTPYASWSDVDPVRSWVRTTPDGMVAAFVTLWRGLSPGVSQAVANRTSLRTPSDHGDPGTVLDPPYQAVQVRGTTGTEVNGPGGALVWSEPDAARWSLTGEGLSPAQLRDIADALVLTGPDPIIPDAAARHLAPLAIPARPKVPSATWLTEFDVCYRAPGQTTGCGLRLSVAQNELPWQTQMEGFIVRVGRVPALVSGQFGGVVWQPARGVQVILNAPGMPFDQLLAIAGTIAPVTAGDPRLDSIWQR